MQRCKYILDMYDIQMEIKNALRPHVGVAVDIADVSPIVIAAFEYCLAGRPISTPHGPRDMLVTYPLPSTVLNELLSRLYRMIERRLTAAAIEYSEEFDYLFSTFDWTDLIIEVVKKPVMKPDHVAVLRAQVQSDLENGDWFSEKIRRFVGLP